MSLKLRNELEIEGAAQMSPALKPCAVYVGRFRYLSSVLQQHLCSDFRGKTYQGMWQFDRFHVHPGLVLCVLYCHYLTQCWHIVGAH